MKSAYSEFVTRLPELREQLLKTDQETRDHFVKGAELVLKDSGIDPKVMLGAVTWVLLDTLQQIDLQAVLGQLLGGLPEELDALPPSDKKDLN